MRKKMTLTMAARILTILAATTLTACDYIRKHDIGGEREDSLYRDAMIDYKAGNIDRAIAGFVKVVRRSPANASARFQLACLQHDSKHDYLDAYFGYREYLMQNPTSDKSSMVAERMRECEKKMAEQLADKYALRGAAAESREKDVVARDLKNAEARISTLTKDLAASTARVAALTAERDRLMRIVRQDDEDTKATDIKTIARDAKSVLDDEPTTGDRIRLSQDVASLRAEEKDERAEAASTLLPPQAPDAKAKRDAKRSAENAERAAKMAKGAPADMQYVVKPGDTLYRIAAMFYGHISAWRRIRDANKAIISTDGRVRVGDRITLPMVPAANRK